MHSHSKAPKKFPRKGMLIFSLVLEDDQILSNTINFRWICTSVPASVCRVVCTLAHSTVYIVSVRLRGGQSCVSYLSAPQFSPQAHSHMAQRNCMTGPWVEGEAGSHVTICYIKSAHRRPTRSYIWTRFCA